MGDTTSLIRQLDTVSFRNTSVGKSPTITALFEWPQ